MKKLLLVASAALMGSCAYADFVVGVKGVVNQAEVETTCPYTAETPVWVFSKDNLKGELRAEQDDEGLIRIVLTVYVVDENGQEQLAGTYEVRDALEKTMNMVIKDPAGVNEVINVSFVAHPMPVVQEVAAVESEQVAS